MNATTDILLPRGLRNRNPGNLQHTSVKWLGMRLVQGDEKYVQFYSMIFGYRALIMTLRIYIYRYGFNTIGEIIRRWTQPEDNVYTAEYIQTVCSRLQLPADHAVRYDDRNTLMQLAAAISYMENGTEPDMREVEQGAGFIFKETIV